MIIYPILIAAARISVIWVRSNVARKVILSTTHVLVLMTIIEIHKRNKEYNDKTY
jgi:hypothetical protein